MGNWMLPESLRLHIAPVALAPARRRRVGTRGTRSCLANAQAPDETQAANVPEVGWLWSRKAPVSKQSLRAQNIKPKKSLGQNFMLDESVLEGIVSAASLSPGDAVLEVGPGTGALTKHLLATGALITAVEKDYALHDRLAAEYAEVPALQLVCGDVLQQNFGQLVADLQARCTAAPILRADGSSAAPKVKVVANLPYYITKDFLLQAVPHGDAVSSLLLMLQDEVAVRLTQEEPGGPDWRAMNILMRYYCTPKYLFKIDKRKYYPAPKVHGAVVRFTLRPQPQRPAVPEEKAFLSLVKRSFLQRRKLLRNALQPMASGAQVAAALAGAGLPEDARAQTLGLDDFVRLAWQLDKLGVGRCGESS